MIALLAALSFVVGILVWGGAAVAAPAVVIKSTVAELPVGTTLEEDATIVVPEGAAVVLVTPQGATLTRTGPFTGPAVGASAGDGGSGAMVSAIATFLTARREEVRVGAVRSASAETAAGPDAVPVAASGRYCVAADSTRLWRSNAAAAQTFTVRDAGEGTEAAVAFPPGTDRVAWPAAVPLRNGATYLVRLRDSVRSARIVVSLMPPDLPSEAHRAAWMIGQGCARQAGMLLERLAAGS